MTHGLVKARGKQRTDSTHVLAAIRTLNRLELVGETLRAALNSLAAVAPQWPRSWVPPEWFDRYAARVEESRLPKGEPARYAHGEAVGADGFRLLEAVDHEDTPRWLGEVPAVMILRRAWLCQHYLDEGRARWRKAAGLPPAGQRIDSPYDPEATFGNKRSTTRTGYKVHLTETCEDAEVHLITNVETSPAVTAAVDITAAIHTAPAAGGCCRAITCSMPGSWTWSWWWAAGSSTVCGWSARCVPM
jgi:transposase